nr:hypothetical protein [Paraburkholderia sp. J10-1]
MAKTGRANQYDHHRDHGRRAFTGALALVLAVSRVVRALSASRNLVESDASEVHVVRNTKSAGCVVRLPSISITTPSRAIVDAAP